MNKFGVSKFGTTLAAASATQWIGGIARNRYGSCKFSGVRLFSSSTLTAPVLDSFFTSSLPDTDWGIFTSSLPDTDWGMLTSSIGV